MHIVAMNADSHYWFSRPGYWLLSHPLARLRALFAVHQDLPALTGLRFFAALTVVLGHGLQSVRGFEAQGLTLALSKLSGIGMSLFFVLSGFVIHYNYRRTIAEGGTGGLWRFLVARFSRLYPLFIVLVTFELYWSGTLHRALSGAPQDIGRLVGAAPYYLTLTHSWVYEVIEEASLVYQFGGIAAVSWSISTEWFFYLCYPLILLVVLRLGSVRAKLAAIAVLSCVAIACVWWVLTHVPAINAYGLDHFGREATTRDGGGHSLLRWLLYFSPWSRIAEFILGVLVCAVFLDLKEMPPGPTEQRLGFGLAVVALAGLGFAQFLFLGEGRPWQILTNYHMAYGYALPVALLIFCVARYRNAVTRFFSLPPLVAVGEVSYSLYLLHIGVIGWLAGRGLMTAAGGSTAGAWLSVALALGVAIAASFVTYLAIEVPARTWFRRVLAPGGAPPPAPFGPIAVWASRAGVAVALVLLPLALVVTRPALTGPRSPGPLVTDGGIATIEATYGANCGAAAGNATAKVAEVCDGRASCLYRIDVRVLGDPANGCAKDFRVTWRCAQNPAEKAVASPKGVGVRGETVELAC